MAERWQYKTITITPTQAAKMDELLNSYGEAGWELVSMVVESWQRLGVIGGGLQAPTYRAVFKAPA
jgi:hypothetical protein